MTYNVTIETRIVVEVEAPDGMDLDELGDAVVEAIGPELDGIEDDLELEGPNGEDIEVVSTNSTGLHCVVATRLVKG